MSHAMLFELPQCCGTSLEGGLDAHDDSTQGTDDVDNEGAVSEEDDGLARSRCDRQRHEVGRPGLAHPC